MCSKVVLERGVKTHDKATELVGEWEQEKDLNRDKAEKSPAMHCGDVRWRSLSGPEENFTSDGTNGPAEITWSSSGSELSDEEKTISKSLNDNGHGSRIDRFCNRKTLCQEDGASENKLQFTDWEIDSDRQDDHGYSALQGESTVEISDGASCASSCSLTSAERLSELPKPKSTEVLEWSSDSGREDDSENVLFIDSESPHKCNVDFGTDARQGMERLVEPWTKSADTILYTPQKQTNKFPRTPEDSAKKKQLIRGGLAERLNELQNRERSAISFWRQQCVSYPKTLKGKSGVLVVKILELHEECTMQVAVCEQLEDLQANSPSPGVAPGPGDCLKIFFTKETASNIKGRPQDIVHIYPHWQKLTIPDESCPVVLNTYFCRKSIAKEDSETMAVVHCRDSPLPRRSITLAQMFRLKGLTPEIQVTCGGMTTIGTDLTHEQKEAKQHFPAHTSPSGSLLDMVGSQGATVGSGVWVRVVVQRVYLFPGRDGASCVPCTHTDPPCARVPSKTPHDIKSSCLLKLLVAVTVSSASLISDDLDSFQEFGQLFRRMPHWNAASPQNPLQSAATWNSGTNGEPRRAGPISRRLSRSAVGAHAPRAVRPRPLPAFPRPWPRPAAGGAKPVPGRGGGAGRPRSARVRARRRGARGSGSSFAGP
ncbi:LOW QUALITY PROTEIN: DNA repair-scaffolding protein-like [Dugong dugon]